MGDPFNIFQQGRGGSGSSLFPSSLPSDDSDIESGGEGDETSIEEATRQHLEALGATPGATSATSEKSALRSGFEGLTSPLRALSGVTGTSLVHLLGIRAMFPEAYAKAEAEQAKAEEGRVGPDFLKGAASLPGLGDVASQALTPEFKESAAGRIVAPVATLAGNILGDPTTYAGGLGILTKGGRAASALGKVQRAVAAAEKAGELEKVAELTARIPALAERLADVTKAESAFGRGARSILEGIDKVGSAGATGAATREAFMSPSFAKATRVAATLPFGPLPGIAYAPELVEGLVDQTGGAVEEAKAGRYAKAAASGTGALLTAGLAALVGKGVLDEVGAARALELHIREQLDGKTPGQPDETAAPAQVPGMPASHDPLDPEAALAAEIESMGTGQAEPPPGAAAGTPLASEPGRADDVAPGATPAAAPLAEPPAGVVAAPETPLPGTPPSAPPPAGGAPPVAVPPTPPGLNLSAPAQSLMAAAAARTTEGKHLTRNEILATLGLRPGRSKGAGTGVEATLVKALGQEEATAVLSQLEYVQGLGYRVKGASPGASPSPTAAVEAPRAVPAPPVPLPEGGAPPGLLVPPPATAAVASTPPPLPPDLRAASDRRQAVSPVPVAVDRRIEARRRVAAELQLPEDHPGVDRLVTAETDARTDPLTGLPNMLAFEESLASHAGPVVTMDANGLGWVNDNLGGHDVGDAYLKAIADAIREEEGIVGHRGVKSDEFRLLADTPERAAEVSERISRRVASTEFSGTIDGKPVRWVGGRIDYGIGSEGRTAGERRSESDTALYAARERAKLEGLRTTTKGGRPPTIREVAGPGVAANQAGAEVKIVPPAVASAAAAPTAKPAAPAKLPSLTKDEIASALADPKHRSAIEEVFALAFPNRPVSSLTQLEIAKEFKGDDLKQSRQLMRALVTERLHAERAAQAKATSEMWDDSGGEGGGGGEAEGPSAMLAVDTSGRLVEVRDEKRRAGARRSKDLSYTPPELRVKTGTEYQGRGASGFGETPPQNPQGIGQPKPNEAARRVMQETGLEPREEIPTITTREEMDAARHQLDQIRDLVAEEPQLAEELGDLDIGLRDALEDAVRRGVGTPPIPDPDIRPRPEAIDLGEPMEVTGPGPRGPRSPAPTPPTPPPPGTEGVPVASRAEVGNFLAHYAAAPASFVSKAEEVLGKKISAATGDELSLVLHHARANPELYGGSSPLERLDPALTTPAATRLAGGLAQVRDKKEYPGRAIGFRYDPTSPAGRIQSTALPEMEEALQRTVVDWITRLHENTKTGERLRQLLIVASDTPANRTEIEKLLRRSMHNRVREDGQHSGRLRALIQDPAVRSSAGLSTEEAGRYSVSEAVSEAASVAEAPAAKASEMSGPLFPSRPANLDAAAWRAQVKADPDARMSVLQSIAAVMRDSLAGTYKSGQANPGLKALRRLASELGIVTKSDAAERVGPAVARAIRNLDETPNAMSVGDLLTDTRVDNRGPAWEAAISRSPVLGDTGTRAVDFEGDVPALTRATAPVLTRIAPSLSRVTQDVATTTGLDTSFGGFTLSPQLGAMRMPDGRIYLNPLYARHLATAAHANSPLTGKALADSIDYATAKHTVDSIIHEVAHKRARHEAATGDIAFEAAYDKALRDLGPQYSELIRAVRDEARESYAALDTHMPAYTAAVDRMQEVVRGEAGSPIRRSSRDDTGPSRGGTPSLPTRPRGDPGSPSLRPIPGSQPGASLPRGRGEPAPGLRPGAAAVEGSPSRTPGETRGSGEGRGEGGEGAGERPSAALTRADLDTKIEALLVKHGQRRSAAVERELISLRDQRDAIVEGRGHDAVDPALKRAKDDRLAEIEKARKVGFKGGAGIDVVERAAQLRPETRAEAAHADVELALLTRAVDAYTGGGDSRSSALGYIPEMRKMLARDLPGKAFDEALLRAWSMERVSMQAHPQPSQLSAAEKAAMISDGRGSYFMGASILDRGGRAYAPVNIEAITSAVRSMVDRKTRGGLSTMLIPDVLKEAKLEGASPEAVGKALRKAAEAGRISVSAADDPGTLPSGQRAMLEKVGEGMGGDFAAKKTASGLSLGSRVPHTIRLLGDEAGKPSASLTSPLTRATAERRKTDTLNRIQVTWAADLARLTAGTTPEARAAAAASYLDEIKAIAKSPEALRESLRNAKPGGTLDVGKNLTKFAHMMSDEQREQVGLMLALHNHTLSRAVPMTWEETKLAASRLLDGRTPEQYIDMVKLKGMKNPADFVLANSITAMFGKEVDSAATLVEAASRLKASAEARGDTVALRNAEAELERGIDALGFARMKRDVAMFSIIPESTRVARALGIHRMLVAPLTKEETFRSRFRGVLRSSGIKPAAMDGFVKMLDDTLAQGPAADWTAFTTAFRKATQPRMFDKFLEFWKAGLLGIPTQIVNIGSNAMYLGYRNFEHAVTSLVDPLFSGLTGAPRTRFVGETAARMTGGARGMGDGWTALYGDLKDIAALRTPDPSARMRSGTFFDDPNLRQLFGAIEGKKGEYIRIPFKLLDAFDNFFKHTIRNQEWAARANRLANDAAMRSPGEAIPHASARIYDELRRVAADPISNQGLFKKPGYEAALKAGHDASISDTFQEALVGTPVRDAVHSYQRATNQLPALQLLTPFMKTPYNILAEAMKRTPVALAWTLKKYATGEITDARFVEDMVKSGMGTMLMAPVFAMALNEDITGSGPSDPKQVELLKRTGWQPRSIKVGSTYYSYQRFAPFSIPMGLAADAAEAYKRKDIDTGSEKIAKVVTSLSENIMDQSFLTGVDSFMKILNDPQRQGLSAIRQLQSSLVPNVIGVVPFAHAARAIDPVYRETEAFTASPFMAQIPGASKLLQPQRRPTGEIREREGNALERLFSPVQRSEVKTDPIAKASAEIARVGPALSPPPLFFRSGVQGEKIYYTPEEREEISRAQEKSLENVARILDRGDYTRLPDAEDLAHAGEKTKRDAIQEILNTYRRPVTERINRQALRRAQDSLRRD